MVSGEIFKGNKVKKVTETNVSASYHHVYMSQMQSCALLGTLQVLINVLYCNIHILEIRNNSYNFEQKLAF